MDCALILFEDEQPVAVQHASDASGTAEAEGDRARDPRVQLGKVAQVAHCDAHARATSPDHLTPSEPEP